MAYLDVAEALTLYPGDYVSVAFDLDGDGVLGVADTTAAQNMLEVCTSEVDSYIVGRVELPDDDSIPLDLKMRVLDLTIYRLCPDALRLTQEKKDREKAARKWLELVAQGIIKPVYNKKSLGVHKTQRARVITEQDALNEQAESARFFSRSRNGRLF